MHITPPPDPSNLKSGTLLHSQSSALRFGSTGNRIALSGFASEIETQKVAGTASILRSLNGRRIVCMNLFLHLIVV